MSISKSSSKPKLDISGNGINSISGAIRESKGITNGGIANFALSNLRAHSRGPEGSATSLMLPACVSLR